MLMQWMDDITFWAWGLWLLHVRERRRPVVAWPLWPARQNRQPRCRWPPSATPRHRRRRERPKLDMLLHFCRCWRTPVANVGIRCKEQRA